MTEARPTIPMLRPGDVLCGRYEILHEVGRGSMGVLYRARHRKLGGYVAVKVLGSWLYANPRMVARFHREARLAHHARHPNVVQILDYDETPWGAPFLVQEFLEGRDLQRLLDEGTVFSHKEIIEILLPVCRALEFIHAQGIMHRDLKPANIMVSRSPSGELQVKLCDFGLAKMMEGAEAEAISGRVVVGTPFYMSPEQLTGKKLDARSDIYSLGVILYQLLTGSLPFTGEKIMDIAEKVLNDPVQDPRERAPERKIPRNLSRLAMRTLSKNRMGRPQSAGKLAEKLTRTLEEIQGQESGPVQFVRRLFALA